MKGLLQKDPPLPRYSKTWDLNIVLRYLKKLWPLSSLNLFQLTMRLAMLLSLCSGKRGQNLHLLDLNFMVRQGDRVKFDLRVPVKNYGKASDVKLQTIEFMEYPHDKELCPVTTLNRYLEVTKPLRMSPKLFLISMKPYRRASRATIARWVKTVMENAGVDTSVYKPHSARSATVSKAASLGIPTDVILSRAGWKSDNCFAMYYLKPIEVDGGSDFQSAVLQLD